MLPGTVMLLSPVQLAKAASAKMTVSGKLKNITEKFRLIPGMETQCEIKVGRRRVIEYIIHPLIKSLDEAIREP